MRVTKITLTEVVVPANPDSVNSPETDHPLHMLAYKGKKGWSIQFHEMPKILVVLETDSGITGYGENLRGLDISLLHPIAEGLIGQDLMQLNWQDLPIPGGRLYDGHEMAVLDAMGKAIGQPLCRMLGGRYRDKVRVGHWTGHRTVADAARKAKEGMDRGYDCIKFKCGMDDPVIDWCWAIRDACGPEFKVILDPNQRWERPADAARFARGLSEVGNVLCLEDPIQRWNLEGFRLLRQTIDIPVALHVALPYPELNCAITDVIRAVQMDAVDYFNFNGGCFPVSKMAQVAEIAAIPFWHGSEVDLGLLEASYVHKCAACKMATLPGDIFGRLVREHDLLVEPLKFEPPYCHVPVGPGLGVELDMDAVGKYRTNAWVVE